MSVQLGVEYFQAKVGTAFEVETGGDTSFSLDLQEVKLLGHSIRPGGSFTLYLQGPAGPILGQGTYTLRSGEDRFDLFIVPLGPDGAGGARYEVIFN